MLALEEELPKLYQVYRDLPEIYRQPNDSTELVSRTEEIT